MKRNILFILLFSLMASLLASSMISAKGRIRKGYLGVSVERLSREEKRELGISHGVVVTRVNRGSAADVAGLLEEDIIQFYADQKIRRPDNLVEAVRRTEPHTPVQLSILRDGQKKNVTVKVGRLRSSMSHVYIHGDDNVISLRTLGESAYLGVSLHELANEDLARYFGLEAERGVLVLDVSNDSPAEKAGMKAGDVIVEMDGDVVEISDDFYEILADFEPEDRVELQVLRQKKKVKVTVELAERDGNHLFFHDFKNGAWSAYKSRVPRIEDEALLEIKEKAADMKKWISEKKVISPQGRI